MHCSSASGPHAIASAQVVNVDGYNMGPLSFCYDANGNMTKMYRGAQVERSMAYTPAERVREIASASSGQTLRFDYGPDRKRYQRREYATGSATLLRTVRYLGNVEVIDGKRGQVHFRHRQPDWEAGLQERCLRRRGQRLHRPNGPHAIVSASSGQTIRFQQRGQVHLNLPGSAGVLGYHRFLRALGIVVAGLWRKRLA